MSSASAEKNLDPYVGTTVAERFKVEELIGAGGMGTVYRAEQTPLGRPVALKLLRDEVAWESETVTRFHREAKAMSLLQNAHTVRVYDFGQTEKGILFLAMELLEGETLTEKVRRDVAVDPVEAIRIVQQILTSLHEAHTKGIIHRDLKPDNIVLADVEGQEAPVVKVLDFGIAKVFEGENDFDSLETQAGTVFGTPRYMSPEQAQGKKLDARSDLYSVGVLMYQLLTGVPPFQDDDAVVVMAQHIREEPKSPKELVPTRPITPRLDKLVLRAIAKSPDRRYQDATKFIEALEKCVPELETYRARPTGVFRAQRERAPIWIAALILLLSALIAGWIIMSGDAEVLPEPTPPPRATVVDPPPLPEPPELTPEILTVQVESQPPGAEVWADAVLQGTTPLALEIGPDEQISVELRLEGFETAQAELSAYEDVMVPLTEERRRWQPARNGAQQAPPSEMTSEAPTTMGDGYERLPF
ncbi:MAG: serine/threonine protein kinase [Polyangiales bacterium]